VFLLKKFIRHFIKKFIPYKIILLARRFFYFIRSIFYKGSSFHCPICSFDASNFIDGGEDTKVNREKNIVGAGHFLNNFCPNCNSGYKERFFFLNLSNFLNQNSNLSILHIAPENSFSFLSSNIFLSHKYITADLSMRHVDLNLNLNHIPFDDNSFDVVIANHVFEHIDTDVNAMCEVFRVLKPNGKLFAQVPFSPLLDICFEGSDPYKLSNIQREALYGQYDHVRIYSLPCYLDRLISAGFTVSTYLPCDLYNLDIIHKYCLNDNEIFFDISKSS